jgi:hypothetical protein
MPCGVSSKTRRRETGRRRRGRGPPGGSSGAPVHGADGGHGGGVRRRRLPSGHPGSFDPRVLVSRAAPVCGRQGRWEVGWGEGRISLTRSLSRSFGLGASPRWGAGKENRGLSRSFVRRSSTRRASLSGDERQDVDLPTLRSSDRRPQGGRPRPRRTTDHSFDEMARCPTTGEPHRKRQIPPHPITSMARSAPPAGRLGAQVIHLWAPPAPA